MYAILCESKVSEKFSQLELLTLVISCIGHDLDHPGYNNAYQINAGTELAIIYNDTSPLENHHAACLFSVLKIDECNLVKKFRRDCVVCILATDMAKHGEITGLSSLLIPQANSRESLMSSRSKKTHIVNS
jgi:high affinity cGMP-specific 3',5'-cyclic phosphodiesterase 9